MQTVQHSFDTFFTPQLYRTSEELRNSLLILQRLYKANEEHVLIEPQLFYDARVNSELTNLKDEYKLWKRCVLALFRHVISSRTDITIHGKWQALAVPVRLSIFVHADHKGQVIPHRFVFGNEFQGRGE